MSPEQIAVQRAIFAALKDLCDGSPRADSRALVAMLISSASRPLPLPADVRPDAGSLARRMLFGAHWVAFSQLLRAVFDESQRQGPASGAAACLRLMAAMVPDLEAHDDRTVMAVMNAIRATATSWQPAASNHGDGRPQ